MMSDSVLAASNTFDKRLFSTAMNFVMLHLKQTIVLNICSIAHLFESVSSCQRRDERKCEHRIEKL